MSLYGKFKCLVCPVRDDGSNVLHYELVSRKASAGNTSKKRRHPHWSLSNIIQHGLIESSWWMVTKRDRRLIVSRHAGANSWLHDLVESDGAARSAGKRYLMTSPVGQ